MPHTCDSLLKEEARGLRRRAGRRRLFAVIAGLVIVAAVIPLSIRFLGRSADASTDISQLETTAATAPEKRIVIAWNPSHQDDTGSNGWHEYAVCGDITQQAMALLPGFDNVLCWETGMGLASGGGAALRSECAMANAANAQLFVAVHVNGGAKSGVTGYYYEGDETSRRYAEALLTSVAASMNMTFHYVRPRSEILVLDPLENHASIRVLLELGDNESDRALLSSEEGVARMAAALAKAVKEHSAAMLIEGGYARQ